MNDSPPPQPNCTAAVAGRSLGGRVQREVLGPERAGYGEQIVATLSHELTAEFGRGFERTNLTRMIKFAEAFQDEEIVATLSRQLRGSHVRELSPLGKPLQLREGRE